MLHVRNNMNDGKKMEKTVKTVKKQARQQQQKRLKRFQEKKKSGNPKTHRGEEKHTQRRETTTERSEQVL